MPNLALKLKCEAVVGGRHYRKKMYMGLCGQLAVKVVGGRSYCQHHAAREQEKREHPERFASHRKFVNSIPMPGLDALRQLAEQVRSL